MDGNKVSNNCANGGDLGTGRIDFGSLGLSGGAALTTVPEPSSFALLLGAACLALPMMRRRRTVAAQYKQRLGYSAAPEDFVLARGFGFAAGFALAAGADSSCKSLNWFAPGISFPSLVK